MIHETAPNPGPDCLFAFDVLTGHSGRLCGLGELLKSSEASSDTRIPYLKWINADTIALVPTSADPSTVPDKPVLLFDVRDDGTELKFGTRWPKGDSRQADKAPRSPETPAHGTQ